MEYSGTVSAVLSQDVNTKRGQMTFWSVALAGQDGFHGFGPKKPKIKKGDKVTFMSEENDRGFLQADVDTLEVTPGKEEVRSNSSSGAVANDSKAKGGYWDEKAARDVVNDEKREIGASRNTAIEWIKFLLANEALPKMPAAAKREEYLNSLLDDYMNKFRGLEVAPKVPEKKVKTTTKPEAEVAEPEEQEEEWN